MPSSELSEMFFFVYFMKSLSSEQYYVGYTSNLNDRIKEHNSGLSKSTSRYKPWEVIYYEAHRSEEDARRREKYLKTTAGKQAISKMLREELRVLSSNHQKVYY